MTGYLAVSEAGEAAEYARILFHLGGGRILSYVLKRMLGRAGTTASPETFAREHELGPDALEMGSDEFTELLTTVRGGAKALLMNQSRLAGIGNIYSDEMLFHAGIHPSSACRELDREARDRLDVARAEVLKTAIDCDVDPDAMPPDWLLPRREDGTSCPRCGGTIRRTVISGRGAYVCPDHQRRYG
jgi:formamidopyrimidine-DNA glycosylase